MLGRPRRHPPTGRGRVTTIVVSALLAVVIGMSLLVGAAAVGTVAVVGALSQDLPDPTSLGALTFAQPTVVYDRTGTIQLGRFQREQRRVVTFAEVPRLVLDATTTAEDRTFWENGGFDPAAIVSAAAGNASSGADRGASTITQQLVRARLLPQDVVAPGADRYLRKAKELIQSARLTGAYPGETGKQKIITAYLNEIFYGHDAYGLAAAARIYFGVGDLSKLTIAQAALLAGLPKSPSNFDPYRYAQADAKGHLVVPASAAPVVRRDWILRNLSTSRWTRLSQSQLDAALAEPVVLVGDQPLSYKAPHFTWQVRRQLQTILGPNASIETGGYTVITTLDWRAEQLAEKWLSAAVIAPNLKPRASANLLRSLRIGTGDRAWINALRGKDLHDAALVTLDYRTGDVLAYVGSAGYYREDLASPKFEP
ncbi:MAG TPA: transglycosylase domain-containing protein, partial [Candidatus Limnocylindrales bacterium]